MEKQEQSQKNVENTFYVTPSLKRIITTSAGNLIDNIYGDDLGIWDIKSGKCKKIISGVSTSQLCNLVQHNTTYQEEDSEENKEQQSQNSKVQQQKELFFLVGGDTISCYDVENDKCVLKISTKGQQIINQYSCDNSLLLVLQKEMLYYPNVFEQPEKVCSIKYHSQRGKVDDAVILQNQNIVYYIQDGDEQKLYLVNPQKEEITSKIIPQNGTILSMIPLKGEFVAIGHNQSIHIINTEKNSIKDMLKGYNEEYVTMLYVQKQNYLITGCKQASIRIWDLKKCRSLAQFGNQSDIRYHQLFYFDDHLISVNNAIRKLKLWNIEKPKSVQPLKFMQGGMKNIQKVIKIDQTIIAMVTVRGIFQNQEMNFSQYLEVVNIVTNEHYLDKELKESNYSLDLNSFLFIQEKRELFYIMNNKGNGSDILCFQKFEGDQKLRKVEFNVEEHKKAFFFKFGRIVIPYNLSFNPAEIFGISIGTIEIQQNSGISVYDFDVKLKLKIQFQNGFNASVVEMMDANNLIFVNQENKMEQWDIQKQKRVEIYETTTDIFTQMKYINPYIFLYNENQAQFVIWNYEDEDIVHRRKAPNKMKKIELADQECILLYEDGKLQLWNVDTDDIRYAKIQFSVLDFVIQEKTILLVGEGFMEATFLDKI